MSKTVEQGKAEIVALCEYFAKNREAFHASGVKEAHVRQSLIDPFFEALGGLALVARRRRPSW